MYFKRCLQSSLEIKTPVSTDVTDKSCCRQTKHRTHECITILLLDCWCYKEDTSKSLSPHSCSRSFMSICDSFLVIHERAVNWDLFLYDKTWWKKEAIIRLLMPYVLYLKTLAESLSLLLIYCLQKKKKYSLILRNNDSSGLCTSHLKFECEFSKEPIFEAEQVQSATMWYAQHCPIPETVCGSRVCIQRISWACSILYTFLKLWIRMLVMTVAFFCWVCFFFFFWLKYVSSGNWIGDHTSNHLLVPRAGFEKVT